VRIVRTGSPRRRNGAKPPRRKTGRRTSKPDDATVDARPDSLPEYPGDYTGIHANSWSIGGVPVAGVRSWGIVAVHWASWRFPWHRIAGHRPIRRCLARFPQIFPIHEVPKLAPARNPRYIEKDERGIRGHPGGVDPDRYFGTLVGHDRVASAAAVRSGSCPRLPHRAGAAPSLSARSSPSASARTAEAGCVGLRMRIWSPDADAARLGSRFAR